MISERVGYWLQVVANLGLLIGLVLVGLQIYQSNLIALSEVYQHRADLRSELHRSFAESSDLAALMVEVQDGNFHDLTETEKIRVQHQMSRAMLLVDNIRFQTEIGLLEGTWNDENTSALYELWDDVGVDITQRLRDWHSQLPASGER